jgi:DsbC/DsbD-like thiol-disulfide interchange protein
VSAGRWFVERIARAVGGIGILLAGAVFCTARPAESAVGPWVTHPEVKLRLVAGVERAARQGPIALGLEFVTEKDWHVYWKNPGDAGFPMAVESRDPALLEPRASYPAPHRFELPGDLQAFGYDGAVVYPLTATLAAGAAGERKRLVLGVDFLTCKIECVPYRDVVELDLPLADHAQPDAEVALLLASWQARVPRPVSAEFQVEGALEQSTGGAAGNAGTGASEPRAVLSFDGPLTAASELFLEAHAEVDFGKAVRHPAPRGKAATYEVPLRPRQRRDTGLPPLDLAWTLTAVGEDGDQAIEGVVRIEPGSGRPEERVPPSRSFGPMSRWIGAALGLAALLSLGLWVGRSR